MIQSDSTIHPIGQTLIRFVSKYVAKLLLKRWVVTDRASLLTSDCWDSDCAFRRCKLENANNVMNNVNFKKTRSRVWTEMKNKQWPAPGKIGWVLYIFGWESYAKHLRRKITWIHKQKITEIIVSQTSFVYSKDSSVRLIKTAKNCIGTGNPNSKIAEPLTSWL